MYIPILCMTYMRENNAKEMPLIIPLIKYSLATDGMIRPPQREIWLVRVLRKCYSRVYNHNYTMANAE